MSNDTLNLTLDFYNTQCKIYRISTNKGLFMKKTTIIKLPVGINPVNTKGSN